MSISTYEAAELYDWIFNEGNDFLLLDVRNDVEFEKFKVEGPYLKNIQNVPYMEFVEFEEESVKKVPRDQKIKIVCAREGSAKYVAEILNNSGIEDVGYLTGGIGTWGDLLKPVLLEKNSTFELYQFIRPGKASLSYGLICGKSMCVFDPARTSEYYISFSAEKGVKIERVFETHLQADYISGGERIANSTGAEIIANREDFAQAVFKYTPVVDGNELDCSGLSSLIKMIHTPGHTPGSTSYLIDNRYLISGDAVFIKSIGRPDLGGKVEEWSKLLYNTIQKVLNPMDGEHIVLPGHYMDWSELNSKGEFTDTLGNIRTRNGEIYSYTDLDGFTDFIKRNMRKQPDVYAEIRKVNAGLLTPPEDDQKIMDIGKNECAASGN